MVEVRADTDVVDADAARDVIEVVEHGVDAARPEQGADGADERRAGLRIRDLPVELEGVEVVLLHPRRAPRGPDVRVERRVVRVVEIAAEGRDVDHPTPLGDRVDLLVAQVAAHVRERTHVRVARDHGRGRELDDLERRLLREL